MSKTRPPSWLTISAAAVTVILTVGCAGNAIKLIVRRISWLNASESKKHLPSVLAFSFLNRYPTILDRGNSDRFPSFAALFPLTSISSSYEQGFLSSLLIGPNVFSPDQFREIRGANYWEKPFAGAHSDIGGGYQDTRNLEALSWMIRRGQAAGAPFRALEKYQNFNQLRPLTTPHDSRYNVLDRIPGTSLGSGTRTIFPGNL